MMADNGVYLYCVCQDLDRAMTGGLAGVGGAPVRGVAHGDLVAVVSTVSLGEFGEQALRHNLEDLAWLEGTVRAHHRVVEQMARATPTVPVRAATVFGDDKRVRAACGTARTRELLARIAGHAEWGAKVYADAGSLDKERADRGRPGGTGDLAADAAAGPGIAYLRRRRADRDSRHDRMRQLDGQARRIGDALSAHAVASRAHQQQDPRLSGRPGTLLLNASYLVAREHANRFTAAATNLSRQYPGIRLEVTGPWPAYSFAGLS